MQVSIAKLLSVGILAAILGDASNVTATETQIILTGGEGTKLLHVANEKIVCLSEFDVDTERHKAEFRSALKTTNDRFISASKDSNLKYPEGSVKYTILSPDKKYLAILTQDKHVAMPRGIRFVELEKNAEVSVVQFADDIVDIAWTDDSRSVLVLKRRFKKHSGGFKAMISTIAGHPIDINEFFLSTLPIDKLMPQTQMLVSEGPFSLGIVKSLSAIPIDTNSCLNKGK